jgi:hypothetical protein
MIRMLAPVLLVGAALALVTAPPVAAQAGKCASAKIKATCKKIACKGALQAKAAQKGTAPDPVKGAKCETSFSKRFAKSEDKGGCVTTGDTEAIETKVDAFLADLDAELNVATGINPSKCEGKKIRAAVQKVACVCVLEAKQAQKGGSIDPAKSGKCGASFSKSFTKAEAKGGCNTTGDADAVEAKVDAFVSDAAAELDPPSTPTTTSTTTSATTSSGAPTTTTTMVPGVELQGALPPTVGRFNYSMTLGLPGANAACDSNFAGTHACEYAELQAAAAAGDLDGLRDINGNLVTRFWAIDPLAPILQQCNDDQVGGSDLNWEYATADTPSRGQRVTLDNATGTLGTLQSSVQCNIAGMSSVGCCL